MNAIMEHNTVNELSVVREQSVFRKGVMVRRRVEPRSRVQLGLGITREQDVVRWWEAAGQMVREKCVVNMLDGVMGKYRGRKQSVDK